MEGIAMNQHETVAIAVWTAKSKRLLDSDRELLGKIGFDESGMPHEIFEGDKPVSLVFAGQYSAGKSTILKALTGIKDIAIGEGITTKEAHSYDWNGIEIIDTPGIHTTLRPDHDEISYQAIANADMLVYVVTQELFDDFIGQNFRRLLFLIQRSIRQCRQKHIFSPYLMNSMKNITFAAMVSTERVTDM
jgi:GTPase Era involved in 16S rRNA processing